MRLFQSEIEGNVLHLAFGKLPGALPKAVGAVVVIKVFPERSVMLLTTDGCGVCKDGRTDSRAKDRMFHGVTFRIFLTDRIPDFVYNILRL